MAFIDRYYDTPAIGGYRDEYDTPVIDRYRDPAINRYEAPTSDTGFVPTTSTADPYLNDVLDYLKNKAEGVKHQDSLLPPPPEYSAKNRPSEPVYKREEKEYQDDDPEAFDKVDVPEPDIYGFYDIVGAMNPPSKAEQYAKTAVFGLMNLISPIPLTGKALKGIDLLTIQNQQNKIAKIIGREPVTFKEAFNFSRGQEVFTEQEISEFAQYTVDENTVAQPPAVDGKGPDRGGWGTPTGLGFHGPQKSIEEIQAMIENERSAIEGVEEEGPLDPFGQTQVSLAPAQGAEGELGDPPPAPPTVDPTEFSGIAPPAPTVDPTEFSGISDTPSDGAEGGHDVSGPSVGSAGTGEDVGADQGSPPSSNDDDSGNGDDPGDGSGDDGDDPGGADGPG